VYDLVIWVASHNPDLDEIVVRLSRVVGPRSKNR
jgi:hypothetical protein